MSLNTRLQSYLDAEQASYATRPHRDAYTALSVAVETRVPGRDVAKVVILRSDHGRYLMAVLPACCWLDLSALARVAREHTLALATEEEVRRLFPDCEVGAMPPFGQLYGLPVFVDDCFPRDETVFFPAGNHHEVIGMPFGEFVRLAAPVNAEFCRHEREFRPGRLADLVG